MMDDKKLNEQESLELISQMINQTKKESAVGSGDIFLIWGYICTLISLAVYALAYISRDGRWGWLYIAVPVAGLVVMGILARLIGKKYKGPKTYQAQSICGIWSCLSAIFAVYMIVCLASWNHPDCWKGMFLFGLLLPGLGTACTGVILKEKVIALCGGLGAASGLIFLPELCMGGGIPLNWTLLMAVAMVISLVIPGHILNFKAKKINA